MNMTIEKAIRILDPETTVEALAEVEYYAGFSGQTAKVQACSDACEAAVAELKYRTPKKVEGLTCPTCQRIFVLHHGEEGRPFCDNCGQALDWR